MSQTQCQTRSQAGQPAGSRGKLAVVFQQERGGGGHLQLCCQLLALCTCVGAGWKG